MIDYCYYKHYGSNPDENRSKFIACNPNDNRDPHKILSDKISDKIIAIKRKFN